MSPSPQRRKFIFFAVSICLFVGGLLFILSHYQTPPAPELSKQSTTPSFPPAVYEQKQLTKAGINTDNLQALARAIAAVGQYLDGHNIDLNNLDKQAFAQVELARILLAGEPRLSAPGLPMRLPDGSVMRMGPDKSNDAPEPAKQTDLVSDTGARIVDKHLIPRRLDKSGRVPIPVVGDHKKSLIEPDAWIAIPYDPALVAGTPLEIHNNSDGKYAISLQADDYSSVRLNGGMIVPGRFYQLDATTVISGAVPIHITIRPIGVLHGLYEKPIRPPQANG